MVSNTAKAVSGLFIFMFAGLFMAYFVEQLNEKGIVIDELVTGSITIVDIMFVMLIFFVGLGLLYLFLKR